MICSSTHTICNQSFMDSKLSSSWRFISIPYACNNIFSIDRAGPDESQSTCSTFDDGRYKQYPQNLESAKLYRRIELDQLTHKELQSICKEISQCSDYS